MGTRRPALDVLESGIVRLDETDGGFAVVSNVRRYVSFAPGRGGKAGSVFHYDDGSLEFRGSMLGWLRATLLDNIERNGNKFLDLLKEYAGEYVAFADAEPSCGGNRGKVSLRYDPGSGAFVDSKGQVFVQPFQYVPRILVHTLLSGVRQFLEEEYGRDNTRMAVEDTVVEFSRSPHGSREEIVQRIISRMEDKIRRTAGEALMERLDNIFGCRCKELKDDDLAGVCTCEVELPRPDGDGHCVWTVRIGVKKWP